MEPECTDSEKIAELGVAAGASIDFLRPKELADDHTPLMPVLKNVVETYQANQKEFDSIMLLYATSPLADPNDISDACRNFESVESDKALLSVTPFPTLSTSSCKHECSPSKTTGPVGKQIFRSTTFLRLISLNNHVQNRAPSFLSRNHQSQ